MITARYKDTQGKSSYTLHSEEAQKAMAISLHLPDYAAAKSFTDVVSRTALALANRPNVPLLRIGLMAPPGSGKSQVSYWLRDACEPMRPSEIHEPDCGDCFVDFSRAAGWVRAYDAAHVRAYDYKGENALAYSERIIRERRPSGVDICQHPTAEFNKAFHHIIEYLPAGGEARKVTFFTAPELADEPYVQAIEAELKAMQP